MDRQLRSTRCQIILLRCMTACLEPIYLQRLLIIEALISCGLKIHSKPSPAIRAIHDQLQWLPGKSSPLLHQCLGLLMAVQVGIICTTTMPSRWPKVTALLAGTNSLEQMVQDLWRRTHRANQGPKAGLQRMTHI